MQATREEARALTDRIIGLGDQMYELVLEAQEVRAWAALGYANWREYVVQEFKVSQSRAYQLVTHAKVVREITQAADSTMVENAPAPNERQVRELAKVPEGQRAEVWAEVVEETGGKPTAKAIREKVDPPTPRIDPFAPLPSTDVTPEEAERIEAAKQEIAAAEPDRDLARRQRVATDLLDRHVYNLSLINGSPEVVNYTPRLSSQPITHKMLDQAEEAIRQIRKVLTEKGDL